MRRSQKESGESLNRRVVFLVAWIFLGTFLGSQVTYFQSPANITLNDFLEYWAAAGLLLRGDNPYSPEQLLAVQQSVGWTHDVPLLMWNPPWTLSFLIPFGLLSYPTGKSLWVASHYGIMLLCAFGIWRLYGGPIRLYWMSWVITFSFVPAYLVLSTGQIGSLILLGLVGFLYFETRKMWSWAGAALVLTAVKPHLLYLFWLALIFWVLDRRQWRLVLGAGTAFLIATIIPVIFTPGLIGQYFHLYSTTTAPTPLLWETPTLGYLLRRLLVVQNPLLQFAPSFFGVLWFLWYWTRHRRKWDWPEQLPLLLLISLSTTFFGWTMDLVVLLPAVLQGAVWTLHSRQSGAVGLAIVAHLGINAVALTVIMLADNALWSFWIAPTLLLAYLALRRQINYNINDFTRK